MPTVMTLTGADEDDGRPRCKRVKTKRGTRRFCPVEQTATGKWKWQFVKSRRARR